MSVEHLFNESLTWVVQVLSAPTARPIEIMIACMTGIVAVLVRENVLPQLAAAPPRQPEPVVVRTALKKRPRSRAQVQLREPAGSRDVASLRAANPAPTEDAARAQLYEQLASNANTSDPMQRDGQVLRRLLSMGMPQDDARSVMLASPGLPTRFPTEEGRTAYLLQLATSEENSVFGDTAHEGHTLAPAEPSRGGRYR